MWVVQVEMHDDEGQLESVEPVVYANEQTARQYADKTRSYVSRIPVLTKVRDY